MSTLLFVEDVPAIREQFEYDIRRKTELEVLTAENGKEALRTLMEQEIDVVLLDLEMPVMDGLETLAEMREKDLLDSPVVVYTGTGNFQKCVKAVQLGAYNFFDKNEVNLEQLIQELENALEHRRLILENRELKRVARRDSTIIGESQAIKSLRESIRKVARVPSNVLIVGESGTGKELVAREIHKLSARRKKPFVAVNSSALPENLVESELFGFEKGAFSGAIKSSKGKFEAANGGTILLDEISEMPATVQAKLLRVLQENEVSRLGAEGKVLKIDVRVISATNRDLEREIQEGQFREDLFFRICTHIIKVPPLRDRLEDIGPLSVYFLERTCERFGIPKKQINRETIRALQSYDWKRNNVRELENIVERMIIQAAGEEILPEHIPHEISKKAPVPYDVDFNTDKTFQELKQEAEAEILLRFLEHNNWHITNTAKALGISNHSNLLKMMRRLNIKKPEDN